MSVIGVIGLGTMGLGIAQVYAAAGLTVHASDAQAAMRDSATARLAASLAPRVDRGRMTPEARDALLSRIRITDDLSPCALIIEAIAEDLTAKQALFSDLERRVPRNTVLATNTSSLSVHALAAPLRHPDRVLGLHFFNPAPAMRLVELIPHADTAPNGLILARDLTAAAGKTVITAPDRPGFIVNRCARPFYAEALALLTEGRTASDIDAAMTAHGYPIGPLGLIDLIGADVHLAATETLWAAMDHHPRYHPYDILRLQVARGHLGRKSGQGFSGTPTPPPKDAAAIALRIEAMLINEALYLQAEGPDADSIDTAMMLAMNVPRGPFAALQAHGAARILDTLAMLERSAPDPMKPRYHPAPRLTA